MLAAHENKCVMLVDDNFVMREAMSQVLGGDGYRVTTAANGAYTLNATRTGRLPATQARVEHRLQPVREQVGAEHGQRQRRAGPDRHPPRRAQKRLGIVQHVAPADQTAVTRATSSIVVMPFWTLRQPS